MLPPETVKAGFLADRFVGVQGFPDPLPDLLVMQRVGTPGQFHVMKWASEQGVATVLDFDDAMWCIDQNNLAWKSWNRPNPMNQHWEWCEAAAGIVDLVTVTTEALARHYGRKHHRTEILPNRIPTAVVDLPKKENEVFTAGWAGYTKTHPGDCAISAPAAHAVLEAGGKLAVIADAEGAAREWGIDPQRVRAIPPQKLGPNYFGSLSNLDLMLVGLRNTAFNRAKSTLKVLEAAAAGVPSIAPDNAPHRELAKSGFPVVLASNPVEWAEAAKEHMACPPHIRRELSKQMIELVRDKWTIEGNAEDWAQAWERAVNRKNR